MAKRFTLRRDENIVELDGGGFQVEFLLWPNDPECSVWYKHEVYSSRDAAIAMILASRHNDGDV